MSKEPSLTSHTKNSSLTESTKSNDDLKYSLSTSVSSQWQDCTTSLKGERGDTYERLSFSKNTELTFPHSSTACSLMSGTMHAKLNLTEFPKSPTMADHILEDPIQPDHTYKGYTGDQHQQMAYTTAMTATMPTHSNLAMSMIENHKQVEGYNDSYRISISKDTKSQTQFMTQNHKQVDAYNDSFSICILWCHTTFLSGNADLVNYRQDGPGPVISKPDVSHHVAISNQPAIHHVSKDPTKVAKYKNSSKPEFEVSTRVAKYEYTSHQALSFPNKLHSLAAKSPLIHAIDIPAFAAIYRVFI
jgi:hypothetical protein